MNYSHGTGTRDLLDVEIRHLRLLVAIVEEGSVTRAGTRLHLSQSALSHQLSDLEERLGAQLFSRTRTGLVLTAAGHQLLKLAYDVTGRLEQARREFAAAGNQSTGALRITTECLTCYHWLPSVMRRLNSKYPGVQIKVDVQSTNRPVQALLAGDVDLALAYSPSRGSLVSKPLFDDELVAVMAPGHPLAKRSYLQPEDFKSETAIHYSSDRKNMLVFQEFFVSGRSEPKKSMSVPLTEAMIEMAKANLGIAILTRWSVEPEVRAGRLVARSLGRKGLRRSWAAMYRKQRVIPPYWNEFVELLRSAFPAGPALVAGA